LAPNRSLIEQLVAQLSARTYTPIAAADVAASYACHGSNVREIFFDLYDRHERLRRAGRTRLAQRAYRLSRSPAAVSAADVAKDRQLRPGR
jgi:hypothetical protein